MLLHSRWKSFCELAHHRAGGVHTAFSCWAEWHRKLPSVTDTSLACWIRYSSLPYHPYHTCTCTPGKTRQDFFLEWRKVLCKALKMKLLVPSTLLRDALSSVAFLHPEFIYFFDVLHITTKWGVLWFVLVLCWFFFFFPLTERKKGRKKAVQVSVSWLPGQTLLSPLEVGITRQAVSHPPNESL